MNSTERSIIQELEAYRLEEAGEHFKVANNEFLQYLRSGRYEKDFNAVEAAFIGKVESDKALAEIEEKNKELLKDLIEIINGDCYKISKDGIVKWRSSMDAGSMPPEFLGKSLEDILCDWACGYGYEG